METQLDLIPLYMLPSIGFMKVLLERNTINFSIGEYWEKQTPRNRFELLGPNGKQTLSIPIVHTSAHKRLAQVQIDYSQQWNVKHWRSIETAYRKAPFFEFYEHYFRPLFINKYVLLAEFNLEAIHAILKALKVKKSIELDTLSRPTIRVTEPNLNFTYNQVFSEKHGFISNLSVLDLIFNEGPNAMDCFGY